MTGFTSDGSLQLRTATLAVLQGAFPRWPAFEIGVPALEHLEWKLGGPGGDGIGEHSVVVDDDRVVGMRLRWLGRAWVSGIEYRQDNRP